MIPLRSPLALALLALALACARGGVEACPGEPVGTFRFEIALPDGAAPSACTAEPRDGTPAVAAFEATLTTDPGPTASRPAALCPSERGATYYGSRAADGTFVVEASSGVAVLDRCGPNCSVSVDERITGTVTGEGAAASFAGTLEERFAYRAGDCGTCALPCAAAYTVTGAAAAPASP